MDGPEGAGAILTSTHFILIVEILRETLSSHINDVEVVESLVKHGMPSMQAEYTEYKISDYFHSIRT